MPDRLISVFAIVIASALLMTSITSGQESPIFPGSPEIETEQPSKILDATKILGSSDDPFPSSAGKAATPSDQPFFITESRHRLNALEQPVLHLAEQVRAMETKQGKDHAESIKMRSDLRVLVQKTFTARQEIQRAELAEFTRRLQMMQRAIDAREQSVDRIVDRRLEELLDPNLTWTHSEDDRNRSATTRLSGIRYGEAPAEPSAQNDSHTPAAQQELRPHGIPLNENSAPAVRLLEPVVVNKPGEVQQMVSLMIYDVSDPDFMKSREVNTQPFAASEKQLSQMRDNKTAKLVDGCELETMPDRTTSNFNGGTFGVPSSSPGESQRDVEYGIRFTVRRYLQENDNVFECVWNKRRLDWNNRVHGIPGVNEEQLFFTVKSPSPGRPGYLCGPFPVANSSDRRFIHFVLDGTTEAPMSSKDESGRSRELMSMLQGEWELEQLTEGDGEDKGNHRRLTVTKNLLNIYAETGEVKNVFQLEVLNDKTVKAVLDPNGERMGLTGMLEITAEQFQLCLGKEGAPPAVIAPGANVIYLSAKRPSGSTPDATPSGSSAANAEFLK